MHNFISSLTPFMYFRIIVSLEVKVGVSSHKLEVSDFFLCDVILIFEVVFIFEVIHIGHGAIVVDLYTINYVILLL